MSDAFYHATKVENLITLGINVVPRYEPCEPGMNIREALLAVCLLIIVTFRRRIASVLRLRWFAPAAGDQRLQHWGRSFALLVVAMAAATLFAVLTFKWLGLMPISNILATIIVVFVIEMGTESVGKFYEIFIPKSRKFHE